MRSRSGIAQKQAARLAPDFGKALAAFAHRRRVDDGQQLLGVLGDQRIEQRLIAVLQVAHIAVFAEGGGTAVERAFAALALVFQRADVRRQQAVQREGIALRLRECRALVEARIHEQTESVKVGAKAAMSSGAWRRGCGVKTVFSFDSLRIRYAPLGERDEHHFRAGAGAQGRAPGSGAGGGVDLERAEAVRALGKGAVNAAA